MFHDLPADLQRARNLLGQAQEGPPTAQEGDVKAQGVRLADVFLFGPLMVYSALDRTPPPWMKAAMLGIGIGTILYNARNYLEVQRRQQEQNGGPL